MRTILIASMALSLAAGSTLLTTGCAGDPQEPPPPAAAKDVDVSAEWSKLHSDPAAQPGAEYKKGHVNVSDVKLETTQDGSGYSVQMPGNHPIPTPAVYKGRVYVSGGFGSKQYYCFEAATGKLVWGVNLDDDGPSTAAIEDDVVVVNTESCTIFALEASTGKMLWSWWLGDPLLTAPTIANGRVYTSYPAQGGTSRHKEASHALGCFDLKTGKILWQRWIDGDVISAPVAVGDEIVAASFGGTVFRFKQESGSLVSALKARATSAPVVVGQEMHFSRRAEGSGGAREALSVWDAQTNSLARQYNEKASRYLEESVQNHADLKKSAETLDAGNGFSGGAPQTAKAGVAGANIGQSNVATLQSFQGSRVLRWGTSNYSCMGDELVCTNPKDGKQVWSMKLKGDLAKQGGFLGAPPVAAGNSLFLTTLEGELVQLSPKNGEKQKSWKLNHPVRFPPAVVDGRVYIGTEDGRFLCVNTGEAKNTGWPQWGGNAQRTGVYSK